MDTEAFVIGHRVSMNTSTSLGNNNINTINNSNNSDSINNIVNSMDNTNMNILRLKSIHRTRTIGLNSNASTDGDNYTLNDGTINTGTTGNNSKSTNSSTPPPPIPRPILPHETKNAAFVRIAIAILCFLLVELYHCCFRGQSMVWGWLVGCMMQCLNLRTFIRNGLNMEVVMIVL